MTPRSWTSSAQGADDVELGISRATTLKYHCAAPQNGPASGLVFLIADFSDDVEGAALSALRHHLAQHHGLLAVSVEYHCYRSRLVDGAQFDIAARQFETLSALCMQHGVALLDRNALVAALGELPTHYEFKLGVIPANGEYQNFGVMQALDHLAVLHDLMRNPDCQFDPRNILAMGVRHGGYLAHLLSKFAPKLLRAVFDVDAYTSTPLGYLFAGQKDEEPPYYYHLNNIRVFPVIHTRWRQEPSSPACFTSGRAYIRDVALASHVGTMQLAVKNTNRCCCYRLMISPACASPVAAKKRQQATLLRQYGFDVELSEPTADVVQKVVDEPEVLNALRTMFDAHYPNLPPLQSDASTWQSSISYLSGDFLYCFDVDEFGCHASIVKMKKEPGQAMFY